MVGCDVSESNTDTSWVHKPTLLGRATMRTCRRRPLIAIAFLLQVLSFNVSLSESFYPAFLFSAARSREQTSKLPSRWTISSLHHRGDTHLDNDSTEPHTDIAESSSERRDLLVSSFTSAVLLFAPSPCYAGEVGARINKAITTSDLGLSVRESVVRGAQVMDKVDGKWEQFSDRFQLGAARSKQDSKPAPKVIPDPLPLDTVVAKRVLDICDNVRTAVLYLGIFIACCYFSDPVLAYHIVRRSFYHCLGYHRVH